MERPAPTMPQENGAGAGGAKAWGWRIPRLPLVVGVIGLGAAVTTGGWWSRRASAEQAAGVRTIRAELAAAQAEMLEYQARFRMLHWQAEKIREAAADEKSAGIRSWSRERARLFEAFVAKVDREEDARKFEALQAEIGELCARGEVKAAREKLQRLPVVKFPPAGELGKWRGEIYARPLLALSRENPANYRALQKAEPDIAAEDLAKLRAELSGAAGEAVTPQAMMKFELLSAVAPGDDPVLADWAAVASAEDFFEQPDAATLARWRKAQTASRAGDWQTAAAEMQAIDRTKVRTRLPFRAAYGKAIFKAHPDQAGAAYPFLEEAAKAGDREARAAVAGEDFRQKRYARALAWSEAASADGETSAGEQLVALYAMTREALPRDLAREAGELRRIVTRLDAPALASLLLARLYEEGEGIAKSAAEARANYRRATDKGSAEAMLEMARCERRGAGAPADLEAAGDWACRAYAAGEREKAVALLIELMKEAPERVAKRVQAMIEQETVAAPAGFEDTRIGTAGMATLKMELARYFDRKGNFAQAARLYAQSGSRDATVVSRRKELTTAHPCEACGGSGRIQSSIPCATCGGKGTVLCHVCDGRGYNLVPGTPPCTTCGGSGTMEQDGKAVACSACGGTGKGRGSVIKKDCTACSHGREACRECTGGRILITKECPECHGTGARALADE